MQRHENKALAIIPARGGSKGIPRKNIVDLGGHPLIAYSIMAAKQAPNVGTVFVSTDDEEIADIARLYGADVPFLRPEELAGDKAELQAVNSHAIAKLQSIGFSFSFSCVLLPTHPFRPPGLVEMLIQKRMEGFSPVVTVREVEVSAGSPGILESDGRITPSVGYHLNTPKKVFRNYGLFFSMDHGLGNSFHLHVVKDKVHLIDIDTMEDLAIAREVLRKGLFSFEWLQQPSSE